MTTYYLGYLRTSGGQLKMFQVMIGLIQMFYLMGINYDRSNIMYVIRMDVLIMLMGTFSIVFTASFMLISIMLGSTEVPFSMLYRLLYLSLTVVMLPATAAFIKEENNHASRRELVVSAVTSIILCIGIFANFVLAYRPTLFESVVWVPIRKGKSGARQGHRKATKKDEAPH